MKLPFFKYHALGNDYIVMDPQKIEGDFQMTEEAIRTICHRNFGVGSDGILYGPFLEEDRMKLRILNPDGSEAEKSGNGIRIFSRYLQDQGYVKESRFELDTLGGLVIVEFLQDGSDLIKVNMGQAIFESGKIPVAGETREVINEELQIGDETYQISCASMGNPHCVIPLDEISKDLACRLGPYVEVHDLFPNNINMQLLQVLDRDNIQIEIWERGAGYTLASGSSSCAAASVAHKLGLTNPNMTVHMPGGIIKVDIEKDGVYMTGPVTRVAVGEIDSQLCD